MRYRKFLPALVAVFMAAGLPVVPARAGQVRVDVGPEGSLSFSPQNISLNQGDQVIWVWRTGSHTVTQGTDCDVIAPIFSTQERENPFAFGWKSDQTGTIPYFCIPHCPDGMTGALTIVTDGVPVADFRITEVSRSNENLTGFVEITNLGDATGNLGLFALTTSESFGVQLPLEDIIVEPGGSVVVHSGVFGTDTQTDLYLPNLPLFALGSVSLIAANSFFSDLQTVTLFLDFVQMGAGQRANEFTAAAVGFWTPGEFLPIVDDGHSLEFCGDKFGHGASHWRDNPTPTPGIHVYCGTPVQASTWGSVKARGR